MPPRPESTSDYRPVDIRLATTADHNDIVKIAKQSKYTRDFTNMIFSGEDCYAQGRIKVGLLKDEIVGFYCIRNRIRDKVTVLYFVGVESELRGQGIGRLLMYDLHRYSTGVVELKVIKDNPAVSLYNRLAYHTFKEVTDKKGQEYYVMRWIDPRIVEI